MYIGKEDWPDDQIVNTFTVKIKKDILLVLEIQLVFVSIPNKTWV